MKLMTKEILKAFKAQGYCDGKPAEEVKVIAKFFNPCGSGTWYCTEYNPQDRVFFGLCCIDEAELGYVSLDELESLRLPLGLKIERDLYYTGTLADAKKEQRV
jgi:hypothetical protein